MTRKSRYRADWASPLWAKILVLNMDDHGYTVAVFNRTTSKVDRFLDNEAQGTKVIGTYSLEDLSPL